MITLPAGVHAATGIPFGLALMGTAWSEGALLGLASAIEDVQFLTEGVVGRTLPKWYGYCS